MCLDAAEDDSASEIHLPAEFDWHMLDKSKFFFLGDALFSGVSAALYPVIVLKTRQQVSPNKLSCFNMSYVVNRTGNQKTTGIKIRPVVKRSNEEQQNAAPLTTNHTLMWRSFKVSRGILKPSQPN